MTPFWGQKWPKKGSKNGPCFWPILTPPAGPLLEGPGGGIPTILHGLWGIPGPHGVGTPRVPPKRGSKKGPKKGPFLVHILGPKRGSKMALFLEHPAYAPSPWIVGYSGIPPEWVQNDTILGPFWTPIWGGSGGGPGSHPPGEGPSGASPLVLPTFRRYPPHHHTHCARGEYPYIVYVVMVVVPSTIYLHTVRSGGVHTHTLYVMVVMVVLLVRVRGSLLPDDPDDDMIRMIRMMLIM